MSMDQLIDTFINDAQLANGCPATWLSARGMVGRAVQVNKPIRPTRWTRQEEEFYIANVGNLSYEAIAIELGRTVAGIRIYAKRHGLPAATRAPGYLMANQVANLLGIDNHKVPAWIEMGLINGEQLPFEGQREYRVKIVTLKMWLIRPESWVYFDAKRIKNPGIKRLVELAQGRWGDEWWSLRQAGDYHQRETKEILQQIKQGRLHGLHAPLKGARSVNQYWALWYVRRSEVERLVIPDRHADHIRWTDRADAFLLRARAEKKTWAAIGRMMKRTKLQVAWRYKRLKGKEGEA